MISGLNKISPHRKDYSLLHTFGAITPDPQGLPVTFSIYDGQKIPNQNTFDDRFVPALPPLYYGCTGEMATMNAGIQDGTKYRPDDFYFATPPGTDYEGRDMRVTLDTAATRGFRLPDGSIGAKRAPYFNCYGAGVIDDFTAAKIALWINQEQRVGVCAGFWWYSEFASPVNGSLPLPSFNMRGAGLHAVLITGWRTLPDGTEELEVLSWQGMGYGQSGRVYVSRPIYNALMVQPWTGAFTQRPLDGQTPVTIGIRAYIDHLVYFLRNLFNV